MPPRNPAWRSARGTRRSHLLSTHRPEVRGRAAARPVVADTCQRGGLYESVVEASDMRVEERQRLLVRRVGHL